MTISPSQLSSFSTAAQPLIRWLQDNCHPHCKAIVDDQRAELVEGIAGTAKFAMDEQLEKNLAKDYTDLWEERPASDFACGNVKVVMEDGSEPWRDKLLNKIIASPSLPMGEKNWPLTPPTMRFGSELERLVKESMPCPDGISLRVRDGMTRSDWVRGEWVCRHPDDGPLYENACYEDVAIESGGKVQALIRVRRVL